MTLEECIQGYVDLSHQAVAYHRATSGKEGWNTLFGLLFTNDKAISAYIAVGDPETTAAKIGSVEVAHYAPKIELPLDDDNFQRIKDELPVLREKMFAEVLKTTLDKED